MAIDGKKFLSITRVNRPPLVSVIIPLYNAEKYISTAINSALGQTWENIEILVINDGSTDNSLAIAEQFKNEKVKIFNQTNKGASVARNLGLANSKGEFIQFLDADDILHKDKIKAQIARLMKDPDKVGLSPFIFFNDGTDPSNLQIISEWYHDDFSDPVDFLLKLYSDETIIKGFGRMISQNAWLIPRDIAKEAGNWNIDLSYDDDGEYFCRIILASKGIIYSSESISYYRKFISGKNISAQKSKKAMQSALKAVKLKYDHLKSRSEITLLNKIFSRMFLKICVDVYPRNSEVYNEASKIAYELNPSVSTQDFYTYTTFYRYITHYFGWKTSAILKFIKYSMVK